MHVHLVLFEAWNISDFVFLTNKRREIAGASELITHLDRRWVKEALAELFDGFDAGWRIEEHPVELLETGAGTAKVLIRDIVTARRLVTTVTSRALRDAPGLEVCGVVSGVFDWNADGALHQELERTEGQLAPVRTGLPGPEARFLRLPVVDECRSTGRPAASLLRQPDGSWEPRSAESRAKWLAYGAGTEGDGLHRLASLAGVRPSELGQVIEYLNDPAEWVGVVYADGNGLGQVFGAFHECVDGLSNRLYADTLRGFSHAVQAASERAFLEATRELKDAGAALTEGPAPVLPLLLGGDDMVALCSGEWALPFTESYLRWFESLTGAADEITEPLQRQGKLTGLSACAGVAVVKPHFPFDAAQQLAYALLREAKQVKEKVDGPCSALSFQVLYDSSGADLVRLRGQLEVDGEPVQAVAANTAQPGGPAQRVTPRTRLTAQPYVVSESLPSAPWAKGRHWTDLQQRAAAVTARAEDGERLLPTTQLHHLREGLFLGPEVADARYAHMLARYQDRGLGVLGGAQDSLFWREQDGEAAGRWVSGLLDALEVEGFLPAGAAQ